MKKGVKKPKILLATSTTEHNFIQLGLYYILSYLNYYLDTSSIPDTQIISFTPKNRTLVKDVDAFVSRICKKKYQLLGLSCYVWNVDFLLLAIKKVKKRCPDITIVLGGPEVTYRWRDIMKHKSVDYIVLYEGEQTFLELVEYLFYNSDSSCRLENIKGLVYRIKNNIRKNPDREPLDLNTVPSPYLMRYIKINKKMTYNLETSRGCPFHCAYCSFPLSGQKRVRYFPLDQVTKEIKLLAKHGVKRLELNDDNFNLNLSRAKQIFRSILSSGLKSYIMLFLNISALRIDEEFVELLEKQGNSWASIGVQSVNPRVLSTIHRIANLTFLEQNLKILNKTNVSYDLQFILGLPGQTFQDIKNDINWAYRQGAPYMTFFKLWLTPGTELYEKAHQYGYVYQKKSPNFILSTPTLSSAELKKAVKMVTIARSLISDKYKETIQSLLSTLQMDFADLCEDMVGWGNFSGPDKWINVKSYIVNKYLKNATLRNRLLQN